MCFDEIADILRLNETLSVMSHVLRSLATACALLVPLIATAQPFVVSNTNDSGAGSLRQAMLDAEANAGFDEISFRWDEARTTLIDDIVFSSDNFTSIVMNAYKQGLVVPLFVNYLKESIPRYGFIQWNNGRITDQDGKGYLVYHYITEKRKVYFKYPKWKSIPSKFFIERTGFYSEREYASRRWIRCRRIVNVIPKMVNNFVFRIVESLERRLVRFCKKSLKI